MGHENKYTQRQWDRIVGIGKVPDEYNIEIKDKEVKQPKKEGETE